LSLVAPPTASRRAPGHSQKSESVCRLQRSKLAIAPVCVRAKSSGRGRSRFNHVRSPCKYLIKDRRQRSRFAVMDSTESKSLLELLNRHLVIQNADAEPPRNSKSFETWSGPTNSNSRRSKFRGPNSENELANYAVTRATNSAISVTPSTASGNAG